MIQKLLMKNLLVLSVSALLICLAPCVRAQRLGGVRPHVIIYKTKKDYKKYVPVQLSADKKNITSYPDPTDITNAARPVALHRGYVLDKRGVGLNTAFLKLRYEEYAGLRFAPSTEELYKLIQDKDPMVELCDCGVADPNKNSIKALNALIDKRQLRKQCKVLK